MAEGHAVDWDVTSANADAGGSVLLKPGCYPFEVTKAERTRYSGGGKIGACPSMNVTIRVNGVENESGVPTCAYRTESLFLWDTMMWKAAAFFRSVGNPTDAEGNTVLTWDDVMGRSGWCRIDHSTRKGNDGTERTYNNVAEWIDPAKYESLGIVAQGQAQPVAPQQVYQASPQQQAYISQQFQQVQGYQPPQATPQGYQPQPGRSF